ncbi:MAG TPA: ubiquitin-conjugating enzyme E2 [Dongiaceae bacterium]|nr:ubiquitin-conjugating enzyme E2 [Dongiaceae bacterium]
MLSPRIRRLKLDHDLLVQRFTDWPLIRITGTAGLPPEVYRFVYSIKGLFVTPTGDIQERDVHHLEVNLSLGYPRRAPQCRMLTPVFHPNFDDATVCIGDFWAASEGLDDLIIRIGRMISYQEYNTKSPLNGLAAKWAETHAHLFPVDARDIAPPSEKPAVAPSPSPQSAPQSPAEEPAAMVAETPGAPATSNGVETTNAAPPEAPAPASDPWSERITID